jgi:hypothetical protein
VRVFVLAPRFSRSAADRFGLADARPNRVDRRPLAAIQIAQEFGYKERPGLRPSGVYNEVSMTKQQDVVFFIGAGFSASFNLPVMANFMNKAKDLYFSNQKDHQVIGETIKQIERYSYVKNYMNINLHNIEDLLSIAYMESLIKKNAGMIKSIEEFIKDVIISYSDTDTSDAMMFCEYLINIKLKKGSRFINRNPSNLIPVTYNEVLFDGKRYPDSNFSVINLNYDLIIEKTLEKILDSLSGFYKVLNEANPIAQYYVSTKDKDSLGIPIAKLHGSVDGFIIPPTWNKTIENRIKKDWELAKSLLENATHLVFLGYSLPSTDNYIKYLLATSLNNNDRLKNISVITIDSDGETKNRYTSLFSMKAHFHNTDIEKFFRIFSSTTDEIDFDYFDSSFEQFK